jgi:hypothetical protein
MNSERRCLVWTLSVAALYVLSYGINSVSGGYYWEFVSDGSWGYGRDGMVMFGTRNAVLWQPRFGYLDASRKNILGVLYSPLIALDRNYWHRSGNLRDPNYRSWVRGVRRSDVHPSTRQYFSGSSLN